MKTNHTPGEWKQDNAEPRKIYAYGGDGLTIADCNQPGRSVTEAEANARLIAAAPELLEACQNLLIAIKTGQVMIFSEKEDAPDYVQLIENAAKEALQD